MPDHATISPTQLDVGRYSAPIGNDVLQTLGLLRTCKDGDVFDVRWRGNTRKIGKAWGQTLRVLSSDLAVSVDGIIISKGKAIDVFEGSQVSLMTKDKDSQKLRVALIVYLHFTEPTVQVQPRYRWNMGGEARVKFADDC